MSIDSTDDRLAAMIWRVSAGARPKNVSALDLAITGLVSSFAVYVMAMLAHGWVIDGERLDTTYVAVPAFLLVTLPLLLRRQAPLTGLGLSIAALALHGAVFGSLFRCGPVYLVAFFFAYSAGLRLPRTEAIAGLLAAHALCTLMALVGDGTTGFVLQPAVLLLWGAGRLVRSRTALNERLAQQTVALRAARDERAHLEVATDRAQLSAELDDLLRRRLQDLARLADAGRVESDPATATSTLAAIEHDGRQILEEMRGIVGALRSENGELADAPLPTLTHLQALLLHAKGAGARLTVKGNPRVLPAGVELSAYRVLEHLLDALDDAPDVTVEISFAEDALGLKVSGKTQRRDLGPAVQRARERVELHRGTLSTSIRGGAAEAVARLPVGALT